MNASERALLLAACGARRQRPAERGLDLHGWERLCADAESLDLAGQLFLWLQRSPGGVSAPEVILARLREDYYRAAATAAVLLAALEELLDALSHAGVPAIALKGAALAESVYGNVALRPMRDLDLLVPVAQLDAADAVMLALGYRADESYRPAEWYRRELHHLPPYVSAARRANVEIHHHIAPPWLATRIPVAELWDRATALRVGAAEARTLGPEDSLLHTCVHLVAANRCVGRLRDLRDVDEQVRHFGASLQWGELGDRAIRYDVAEPLFMGLWLSRTQLGTDVPQSVLLRLSRSAGADSVRGRAARGLARRAIFKTPVSGGIPPWVVGGLVGRLLRPEGSLAAGAGFVAARSVAFVLHQFGRSSARPQAPPPSP